MARPTVAPWSRIALLSLIFILALRENVDYPFVWFRDDFSQQPADPNIWVYSNCSEHNSDPDLLGSGMLIRFSEGECYMYPNTSAGMWDLPIAVFGARIRTKYGYTNYQAAPTRPDRIPCCHDENGNGGIEFGFKGLSWINYMNHIEYVSPCQCTKSNFCGNFVKNITEGWHLNGSLVQRFLPDPVAYDVTELDSICYFLYYRRKESYLPGFDSLSELQTTVLFENYGVDVSILSPSLVSTKAPSPASPSPADWVRLGGTKSSNLDAINNAWILLYVGFELSFSGQCFDNNTVPGDGCNGTWVEPLCVCRPNVLQTFHLSVCECSDGSNLSELAGTDLAFPSLISPNNESLISTVMAPVILDYAYKSFFVFATCPHGALDCFDPSVRRLLIVSINGTWTDAYEPELIRCSSFGGCFAGGLFVIDLAGFGAPFPFGTTLTFVWWSNVNPGYPPGLLSQNGPVVAASTVALQPFVPVVRVIRSDLLISGSDESPAVNSVLFSSNIRKPDSVELWVYEGTVFNTTRPAFIDPLDPFLLPIRSNCTHSPFSSGAIQHNCTVEIPRIRYPSNDLFLVARITYGSLVSNISSVDVEIAGTTVTGLLPPVIAQDTSRTRVKIGSLGFPDRIKFQFYIDDVEILVTEDRLARNRTHAEFVIQDVNRDGANRLPRSGPLKVGISDGYRSLNFTISTVFPCMYLFRLLVKLDPVAHPTTLTAPPHVQATPSRTYFLENSTLLIVGDGFNDMDSSAHTVFLQQDGINVPLCDHLIAESANLIRCVLSTNDNEKLSTGIVFASVQLYDGSVSVAQIVGYFTGLSVFSSLQPPAGVLVQSVPRLQFRLESELPFQCPNWHSLTIAQSLLSAQMGLTNEDFYSEFSYQSTSNHSAYNLNVFFITESAATRFNSLKITTNTTLMSSIEDAISGSTERVFTAHLASGSESLDPSWPYLIYQLDPLQRSTPPTTLEQAAIKSIVATLWKLPAVTLTTGVRYAASGVGYELAIYFKTAQSQDVFMTYRLPINSTVIGGKIDSIIQGATENTFSSKFLRGSAFRTTFQVDPSWNWVKFQLASAAQTTISLVEMDSIESGLSSTFNVERVDLYVQFTESASRKRSTTLDMVIFFMTARAEAFFASSNLPYNGTVLSYINSLVATATQNTFNSTYVGSSLLPPTDLSQSSLPNGALAAAIAVPIILVIVAGAIVGGVMFWRRNSQLRRLKQVLEALPRELQTMLSIKASDIVIGQKIGEGSFGAVFSATLKGRRVAVKKLAVNAASAQVADFFREASVMLAIKPHKNVVRMIGMCRELNNMSMVMEFVDGTSLESYCKKANVENEKLSEPSLYVLLRAIALGMRHLAKAGIVHRDLAARNILLTSDLTPKVADFGLSRMIGENQTGQTNSQIGPIRWMSPENLGASQYSEKSDVWSYGCVIIELITGDVPFGSRDIIEIGVAVRDKQLSALAILDPSINVPEWTRELMVQCFSFEEQSRPTFAEIVQFLDRNIPAGVLIDSNEDDQPEDLIIPAVKPEVERKSGSSSSSSSSESDSDCKCDIEIDDKRRYELDSLS